MKIEVAVLGSLSQSMSLVTPYRKAKPADKGLGPCEIRPCLLENEDIVSKALVFLIVLYVSSYR